MEEQTRYEVREDIAWITLDRPERRNALSDAMVRGLGTGLQQAMDEPAVRMIVLTGNGPAFCAGADLRSGGPTPAAAGENPFVEIMKLIWEGPKPVIGRINGHAFGGGLGLVAACDITVAADSAKFSFSEVRVGVIPAMISVVVLRKLGIQQAMYLFLTAERFSAQRAVELGLVHRAVPAADLDATVQELGGLIRQGGPQAVREAKQLIRRIPEMTMDDGFAYAADKIAELFASPEAMEGMRAFAAKEPPAWVQRGNEWKEQGR
jgi:methylglutaconyl-CoA hydratase